MDVVRKNTRPHEAPAPGITAAAKAEGDRQDEGGGGSREAVPKGSDPSRAAAVLEPEAGSNAVGGRGGTAYIPTAQVAMDTGSAAGVGATPSIPAALTLVVVLVAEGGGSPPDPAAQGLVAALVAEVGGLPLVPIAQRLVV